jgi:glyoxylase-like metal-dependent hydrolase (beta-lactamase superfamily II)
MQTIATDIYIDDHYLGATVGAISLPHGLVQIDAPPSPEDGRSWRAALMNMGSGAERLLIVLDAHPDRTLGARAMDCAIIAQEKTAHVFRNRPTTFKSQGEETGADWEIIPNLGNIRWAIPEITFSQQLAIHWSDSPVIVEHHPGPAAGAAWVILPEAKVVFIGDAVLKNQPPFLAGSDLAAWLDTLKLLLSSTYRNWLVVSGRGGVVPVEIIRTQRDYLERVLNRMEKISKKRSPSDAVEALIPSLLNPFKIPNSQLPKYTHRLRYGLQRYFAQHYRTLASGTGED